MGWRAGQKSLLLPVAGEVFLLTLPFIERRYRRSAIGKNQMSGFPTNRPLGVIHCVDGLVYSSSLGGQTGNVREGVRHAAGGGL